MFRLQGAIEVEYRSVRFLDCRFEEVQFPPAPVHKCDGGVHLVAAAGFEIWDSISRKRYPRSTLKVVLSEYTRVSHPFMSRDRERGDQICTPQSRGELRVALQY